MRRNNWMAIVAVLATTSVAACAGDAGDTEAEDTGTEQTTPAQTPQATPQQPAGPAPEGATPEMVAQGQQVFGGKGLCFSCHGQDATGTGLAPNLTDSEWLNIPDGSWSNIQQVVRNGVPTPKEHPSPMPPMGGAQLSDQEIQSVAAYVYSVSQGG